jgi:hypothetical protein
MENKLLDFITMLNGRIAWDKGVTKDCPISQAIYTRIQNDIKEVKDELDSKEY